jgi:hypothetical protein
MDRECERHLGFTPQHQVRWLSPGELGRTAVKVTLSSVFADYADRREVQAALPASPLRVDPDADGGLWLDYVADLGDGFDPTYTVACLLAAPELQVEGPDGGPARRLPRGRVLVMGGDEVYPTPSATGYEDRTKGPYRAALPAVEPGRARPVLLALPGNHDWYDGLTAFLRVFAQRRAIGAWRTIQTRSYFAVRLPQNWWLVGLDTQLGEYIDDPQIRYFREHLSAQLQPGDAVVIAAAEPTWVRTGMGDLDAFNSLHYFEREVVENHLDVETGERRPTGARVRLWLSGDLHHYARYAEEPAGHADGPEGDADGPEGDADGPRQLITCGLGGAFLSDTHRLPTSLVVPPRESRMSDPGRAARFDLAARWPSAERSRRLSLGILAPPPRGLPFRNPGFWRLAGGVHTALLLLLTSLLGLGQDRSPAEVLQHARAGDVGNLAWQVAVWLVIAQVLVSLAPVARMRAARPPSEYALSAAAQLALGFVGLAVLVALPWPPDWSQWAVLGVAVLLTWFGTGLAGAYLFALYVLLSRKRGVQGWQLAAQSLEDHKGFLRLRIDVDGRLTVHPLLVEKVVHDWELPPARPGEQVRPVPAGGLPRVRLIEEPVTVTRGAAPQAEPAPQPSTMSEP